MNSGMTQSRVAAVVADLAEAKGTARPIGADERLVDVGLTSMDMVSLMLAVEAEFDIMIPPEDITPANFRSIASIEALVERVGMSEAA